MNNDIKLSLTFDGNFILNRFVFALSNDNLLYGALYNSLEKYVVKQLEMYNFDSVYFVSDSKGSWRKNYLETYKDKDKSKEIDWEFCYNTYNKFKEDTKHLYTVIQRDYIEGDDWISYITKYNNHHGISNLIISNDHDLYQLLNFDINANWINIMTNQLAFKSKLFLPVNYRTFMSSVANNTTNLFELNENDDFVNLLIKLRENNTVEEIDSIKELFCKIIAGDKGDCVPSVYYKNNRGIGMTGAYKIYEKFYNEYGAVDFNDTTLFNNMSDIICEVKKLSSDNIKPIEERIKENFGLVSLDFKKYPQTVLNEIKDGFKSAITIKN